LNGVIVAAGGHTGTGGSSRYTAAFELLEVDRSSTFVVCGLWFVVCGVWFVVCGGGLWRWFVVVVVVCGGLWFVVIVGGV
jgi:hypothetical protein